MSWRNDPIFDAVVAKSHARTKYVISKNSFFYHNTTPDIICISYWIKCTSGVLSFRMVFFYLVTTGWIFNVSLIM